MFTRKLRLPGATMAVKERTVCKMELFLRTMKTLRVAEWIFLTNVDGGCAVNRVLSMACVFTFKRASVGIFEQTLRFRCTAQQRMALLEKGFCFVPNIHGTLEQQEVAQHSLL